MTIKTGKTGMLFKSIAGAVAFGLLAVSSAHAAAPLKPIRVIMIGDSTMTDKSGYGVGFCAQFKPEVTCVNLSRGGRSSKSYRVEGLWDKAMELIKTPKGADGTTYAKTYVWIEWAHNDGSPKPERHTDIVTEFPLNMRKYGEEIQAAGAVPIFATPLTQRWFKNGKLQPDLLPWSTAIKLIARDKGWEVVDFYAASQKAVQDMGLPAANRMGGDPIPQNILDSEDSGTSLPAVFTDASQATTPQHQGFDYTHLGEKGSAFFGKLAVDTWAAQDKDIKAYVKE
jgi:lysophospholipase L1-like esterase